MINLLIVDDDVATVEVIRDSVNWKKLDIDNVYTSIDASGAKKILLEKNIDIIVSDIEMPQETGLDLLKWVRNKKIECEFLFLTCHENFSYASNAINYDAAAYLTKPFDIDIMEFNLQKIVMKLKQMSELKKASEYGMLMDKNSKFIKLNFWKEILEGEFTRSQIEREIASRHLDIDPNKKYCLLCSKLSHCEEDIERYEKGIFEFIVEDFHYELLTGKFENDGVVKYHIGDTLWFVTVCEEEEAEKLKEKCEKLIKICREYFKATVTCCISGKYDITELSNEKQRLIKLLDYNVKDLGKAFFESDIEVTSKTETQILDLAKLSSIIEKKDRLSLLCYLKHVFAELSASNKLNQYHLYLIKQEVMQAVYSELMERGIHAAKLFCDDISINMTEHAANSTVDLVRWVNFLLEKTFDYEEEVAKEATIIDKINRYIRAHYNENIGRNEIAGEVFLTPEYLSKLYKKKTGVSLKDYINEYRIEKAKELLKSGSKNVSEIAQSVGFDNYSYFSTVFKKVTGKSPKDYKSI